MGPQLAALAALGFYDRVIAAMGRERMRRPPAWSGVAAACLFGVLAVLIAMQSDAPAMTAAAIAALAAVTSAALAVRRRTWIWGAPVLLGWFLLPAIVVRLMTGDGALAGTWVAAAIAGAGLLASFDQPASHGAQAP